jgi:hypothetical protein
MPESLDQLDLLLVRVAKTRQVRRGWDSFSELALYLADARRLRWRNGDSAL